MQKSQIKPTLLELLNQCQPSVKSARFVFNDFRWSSSVTSMLNNLHWPTLESRRQHAKLTMLYKILNNKIAVPHDYIIRTVLATHGHDFRFIQLASRTNTYLICMNSFFPSTVRLWNTLPSYVIDSTDLDNFKTNLDNYFNFNCKQNIIIIFTSILILFWGLYINSYIAIIYLTRLCHHFKTQPR